MLAWWSAVLPARPNVKKPADRTRRRAATLAASLSFLMVVAALPAASGQAAGLPPLGMPAADVSTLKSAGAAPGYASYWAGEWMANSGWGGFDNAMRTARAQGVTPVVYWYYWGDSISPSCVDHGCNSRNRAEWNALTDQLAAHLRTELEGREVLVVLENEFNKQGITGSYAPTFDAYLEGVAKKLKAVPGVKIVLGFGAWGENEWTKFPRSAAQSEYIGFQMMRASTRDTEEKYRGAADRSAYLTGFIADKFQKPSFLYDLALSSYPDSRWARIQAETLDAIFRTLLSDESTTGLHGIVYRTLDDHYMDPKNYYGVAESHWGLRTGSGSPKPAYDVWLKYAKGSATPPPPATPPAPNVPGSFEAESMSASRGGRVSDSSASGGAYWNLWGNGELTTALVTAEDYDARIRVRAAGQPAGGVDPHMEIRVGSTTIAAFSVPKGFAEYEADVRLPKGSSTLRLVYTNDAIVNGVDRNLLLDVAHVGPRPTNAPPSAAFSAAPSGLEVRFDGRASSDPDGDALSHAWSFGDGQTAIGTVVTHTYAAGGTYSVTMTVSDGRGGSATATRDVSVTKPNEPPIARASASGALDRFTFDASASSDPDGDALTFRWDLGDGRTATGARVEHTYATAGERTATVTVTDAHGASSAASVTVTAAKEPEPFGAQFSDLKGNDWWVQVDVAGNRPIAAVCASVDGGACRPLTLRSYGWAESFHVPPGSIVTFRATAQGGETVTSGGYRWPDATPVGDGTSAPTARFAPYDGNDWWVQTRITANQAVRSVCATLDDGACRPLTLRHWGAWAESYRAPKGTKVVFHATLADNTVAKSPTYTWPVK